MTTIEQEKQMAWKNDGNLPLVFIPNEGQMDHKVHYYGRHTGNEFYFTRDEAIFVFQCPLQVKTKTPVAIDSTGRRVTLALHFSKSHPEAKLGANNKGTGKIHYLTGNDPSKWITNLPTYHEILYRELWPGVDLLFQEESGRLKYFLMIQPGALNSNIRMTYRGADDVTLDDRGNLQIHTPSGIFIDERPVSYQEIDGKKVPIKSFFVIEEEKKGEKRFGFGVGEDYDPHYPLLIDPGLVYSTYLGGSSLDQATRIAVDSLGHAVVTGYTNSINYPGDPVLPPHPIQPIYGGGVSDAFVTKLTADGSGLIFSTFLGGSGEDQGLGIALDSTGNVHVTGLTNSLNFPVTAVTAFQSTYQGGAHDAFYAKISADGSTLLYSTYLGGAGDDISAGVAVDSTGKVFLTGQTNSMDFPVTADAFQGVYQGGAHDAFVSQINPLLSGAASLRFSSYFGGSGDDRAMDVAVENVLNGSSFYITGATNSINLPTLPGDPVQPSYGGGASDAFVIRLFSSDLDVPMPVNVVYSTYLGGSGLDEGRAIAVDFGRAFVTGRTNSLNFPGTPLSPISPGDPIAPPQPFFQGGASDAFLAILDTFGKVIDYATYLGGSDEDVGNAIAVNPVVFVAGFTRSLDFPVTEGAVQSVYQGGAADGFATKIDPSILGSDALIGSTYLGGAGDDRILGGATTDVLSGSDGTDLIVVGATSSQDFPTTPGAFQETYQGGVSDGFVSKLDFIPVPPLAITCSPDITVMNDPGLNGAFVDYPEPAVIGGIPSIAVECSPPAGSFFPRGTTTVTCTAIDAAGNTSICSFNISVVVDPCRFFSRRCRPR